MQNLFYAYTSVDDIDYFYLHCMQVARRGRVWGTEAPGEATASGERENGCSIGTEEEDWCSRSEQDKWDKQAARYPSVRREGRERGREKERERGEEKREFYIDVVNPFPTNFRTSIDDLKREHEQDKHHLLSMHRQEMDALKAAHSHTR